MRLLGELALIDERPRSASVIAEGSVTAYKLGREEAGRLLTDVTFLRGLADEGGREVRLHLSHPDEHLRQLVRRSRPS